MRRPSIHGSSSSRSGTTVDLPVPGGARSTATPGSSRARPAAPAPPPRPAGMAHRPRNARTSPRYDPKADRAWRPAPTCATWPSSPTSTTARPPSSTSCCGSPAPSAPTRTSPSGSWTPCDLEREKGITILAKNTTVALRRGDRSTSSTRPATPTSAARSSGASRWSTACCCSSTPSEGPLPQTRFVLRKALAGPAAGDPRRQQGRPARRPHRRGRARGRGAVPRPRRRRRPARLPDRLLRVARRPGRRSSGPPTAPGCPRAPTCARWSTCCSTRIPAPTYDPDVPAAGAGHQPRRLALRRPPRPVPHPLGPAAQGPAGGLVPGRRHHRAGQDHRALRDRGARPGPGRRGRPRRDRRHRRHPRHHHRRDARRPRRPPPAAGHHHRRAEPVDDDRHQHVAAGRPGGLASSRPGW